MDRGFESDATFFEIVAGQSRNSSDRRELLEVAKTYRALSKGATKQPFKARRDHWAARAEECRTLAEQFRNPVCQAQLQRLADTYEMMVLHCDPVEQV